VERQLTHMRGNVSADAAHRLAAAWLVENGPTVLRRADPAIAAAGTVRDSAVVSEEAYARVMAKQVEIVREAMAAGKRAGAAAAPQVLADTAHAVAAGGRHFLDAATVAALERRGDARASLGVEAAPAAPRVRVGTRGRADADLDTAAAMEEDASRGASEPSLASGGVGALAGADASRTAGAGGDPVTTRGDSGSGRGSDARTGERGGRGRAESRGVASAAAVPASAGKVGGSAESSSVASNVGGAGVAATAKAGGASAAAAAAARGATTGRSSPKSGSKGGSAAGSGAAGGRPLT